MIALAVFVPGGSGSDDRVFIDRDPYGSILRFSATEDPALMVVVRYMGQSPEDLALFDPRRWMLGSEALVDALMRPETHLSLVDAYGHDHPFRSSSGEWLPLEYNKGEQLSCTSDLVVGFDRQIEAAIMIAPGVCGMWSSLLTIEFGPEGVQIGDISFIAHPAGRSEPGTVAIDRPASRGYSATESADVVLAPVPAREAPPIPWSRGRHERPATVCFDVTVHAGTSQTDSQIVPEVVISEHDAPVPIPEPFDQWGPRVMTQPAGTTVVWSFGPINLDEYQPDEITVTASEGEITSWGVSARHC